MEDLEHFREKLLTFYEEFSLGNTVPLGRTYLEVMLVTELTLHVDTLRQRPGVWSITMVVLQALHLPALDVNLGVLHLLQTT